MEQPGQVLNSDHIINLSASPEILVDCPTALPLSTTTTGVPQLAILATNDSSSNNSSRSRDGSHLSSSIVNSRLQLCLEIVFIAVQITASAVVLTLSNHERSHTLFRELIISYGILCFVALYLLYWEYCQTSEHDSDMSFNICFQKIILFETFLSFIMEDDGQRTIYRTRSQQYSESPSPTQLLMNSTRILLNIFFVYWLIFSGLFLNTSPQSSKSLLYWYVKSHSSLVLSVILGATLISWNEPYSFCKLTALFFTYGCFEYILAIFICPVLSISGVLAKQEVPSEVINALPTHRLKLKRDNNGYEGGAASNSEKGGIVAAGTDMERVISGEDAVCSVCLDVYADNDKAKGVALLSSSAQGLRGYVAENQANIPSLQSSDSPNGPKLN